MLRSRMLCVLAALCLVVGLCAGAFALEVDSDSTYCFTQEDFSQEEPASETEKTAENWT